MVTGKLSDDLALFPPIQGLNSSSKPINLVSPLNGYLCKDAINHVLISFRDCIRFSNRIKISTITVVSTHIIYVNIVFA